MTLRTLLFASLVGCGSVERPQLCVESLTNEPALTCEASPSLTTGKPVLVTHILPLGVDPHEQVELALRAAGIEQRQTVDYLLPFGADAGSPLRATAIFDFPQDAGCAFLVSSTILNSKQSVTAQVEGCQ